VFHQALDARQERRVRQQVVHQIQHAIKMVQQHLPVVGARLVLMLIGDSRSGLDQQDQLDHELIAVLVHLVRLVLVQQGHAIDEILG